MKENNMSCMSWEFFKRIRKPMDEEELGDVTWIPKTSWEDDPSPEVWKEVELPWGVHSYINRWLQKGEMGKSSCVELNCLSSWENFTWFCAGNPCISVFIKAVEKAWNNETKKFVDSIRLFRSWYCRDCKRTSLYWLLDDTMRFHQVKCGHEPGDIIW